MNGTTENPIEVSDSPVKPTAKVIATKILRPPVDAKEVLRNLKALPSSAKGKTKADLQMQESHLKFEK